jgi:hypothetical protein
MSSFAESSEEEDLEEEDLDFVTPSRPLQMRAKQRNSQSVRSKDFNNKVKLIMRLFPATRDMHLARRLFSEDLEVALLAELGGSPHV